MPLELLVRLNCKRSDALWEETSIDAIEKSDQIAIADFLAKNAIGSFSELVKILPRLTLNNRTIQFVSAYNPAQSVTV